MNAIDECARIERKHRHNNTKPESHSENKSEKQQIKLETDYFHSNVGFSLHRLWIRLKVNIYGWYGRVSLYAFFHCERVNVEWNGVNWIQWIDTRSRTRNRKWAAAACVLGSPISTKCHCWYRFVKSQDCLLAQQTIFNSLVSFNFILSIFLRPLSLLMLLLRVHRYV